MDTIFHTIDYHIDVCRRERLDRNWRTENFALRSRIVPFSRLYLPLSGQGFIIHGGVRYSLERGKLFLVPPLISTQVWCDGELEMYWSNFNALVMSSTLDIFSIIRPVYELPVDDEPFLIRLFELISRHYELPNRSGRRLSYADELQCRAALMLLIQPFLSISEKTAKENLTEHNRFFSLLEYIEQHLEHRFTLKNLAKEFHLHPTYLTNLFARNMGVSLIHYCNQRKLNHAVKLLGDHDYSIAEIAYSLGADDVNNFARLFKRHHGISPQKFREALCKNNIPD